MPCEKYSGWMTDAALGELRAERELLAHAMECDACREALSHARAVHDFVDRGVESLVAGEPSPHFATNLRRRIAALPMDGLGSCPRERPSARCGSRNHGRAHFTSRRCDTERRVRSGI
jgi:hypothetical protein